MAGLYDTSSGGEFAWYDYLIFIVTLVIALGIGIYYAFSGDRQRTTKEYLMANRSLGILPVALSMFMSYISAILVLGNTAEMYTFGATQWFAALGSSIAYGVSALIFVPLFFPLKITSSFEYLQMRFNSQAVKLSGTILLMLSQVIYMGIAMYSPATAMESVTPIPTWASIIATGVIGTIYTSIGGMKAVVWADVFQGLVMIGGVIAVLAVGTDRAGGIDEVWRINKDAGRLDINFDFDPFIRMSFWSVIVGRTVSSMQTTGTGQTSVQRYCAMGNIRKAQAAVALNIPLMAIVYSITCLCGLAVFAYYDNLGCDILRTDDIDNQNQLLPYFIVNVLQTPALPGLFVAVLFSGALSTVSSSLNSLSAVTWKDILEPRVPKLTEFKQAMVTKILAAAYGVLAIGFSFLVSQFGGHVLQISNSFVSGVAGPLLGVFILGSFFPCSNWIGAVAGAWVGLALNLVIIIGNTLERPYRQYMNTTVENCYTLGLNETYEIPSDPEGVFILFKMSFMWFPGFGTITCIIIGLIVSLGASLYKGEPIQPDVHPALIVPFFDRLACCLPTSLLKTCWCRVPHDEPEYDEDGYLVSPPIRPELEKDDIKDIVEPDRELTSEQNGVIPDKYTELGLTTFTAENTNGHVTYSTDEGHDNLTFRF